MNKYTYGHTNTRTHGHTNTRTAHEQRANRAQTAHKQVHSREHTRTHANTSDHTRSRTQPTDTRTNTLQTQQHELEVISPLLGDPTSIPCFHAPVGRVRAPPSGGAVLLALGVVRVRASVQRARLRTGREVHAEFESFTVDVPARVGLSRNNEHK
jgi:hypothetical protein